MKELPSDGFNPKPYRGRKTDSHKIKKAKKAKKGSSGKTGGTIAGMAMLLFFVLPAGVLIAVGTFFAGWWGS